MRRRRRQRRDARKEHHRRMAENERCWTMRMKLLLLLRLPESCSMRMCVQLQHPLVDDTARSQLMLPPLTNSHDPIVLVGTALMLPPVNRSMPNSRWPLLVGTACLLMLRPPIGCSMRLQLRMHQRSSRDPHIADTECSVLMLPLPLVQQMQQSVKQRKAHDPTLACSFLMLLLPSVSYSMMRLLRLRMQQRPNFHEPPLAGTVRSLLLLRLQPVHCSRVHCSRGQSRRAAKKKDWAETCRSTKLLLLLLRQSVDCSMRQRWQLRTWRPWIQPENSNGSQLSNPRHSALLRWDPASSSTQVIDASWS